jgi:hypothetical protein
LHHELGKSLKGLLVGRLELIGLREQRITKGPQALRLVVQIGLEPFSERANDRAELAIIAWGTSRGFGRRGSQVAQPAGELPHPSGCLSELGDVDSDFGHANRRQSS